MSNEKILVLGAGGQIGSVLTERLRIVHGTDNVIATDIRPLNSHGPSAVLDALDAPSLLAFVKKNKITQIYHLVAILSARSEKDPMWAWDINMRSLFNVLEIAKNERIKKIFFPSSIAVFGEGAPAKNTPQDTVLIPNTVYGISKVAAENWCRYYFMNYGVDVRSLRYPGIIGYQSLPGGGTTDYAVDIYHSALAKHSFQCFLGPDTSLPMIYMDDAIRATIELMEAASEQVKVRTSYNLSGMSFSPKEQAAVIQEFIPNFTIEYRPDFRQKIADSWPDSIDDSVARADWAWKPQYDLEQMSADMFAHLEHSNI